MKALLASLTPSDEDWALAHRIDPARLPRHVAIIMDGNGRWARRRGLARVAGHRAGMDSVKDVVAACAQLGLEALTLYAFSAENWKRPAAEVDTLWGLMRLFIDRELRSLSDNNVRLHVMGRVDQLPPEVRASIRQAVQTCQSNTGLVMNVAINYGGRAEIVDAMNRLIAEARTAGRLDSLTVDEAALAGQLYTAGQCDPDLLIRTSGEMRVSNFLLWQIAYAELYVTDVLWPDFRRADLLRAILDFQKRDRRFGGLTGEPAAVGVETIVASAS